MTKTGSDIISEALKAEGLATVFSLAGASHTYLLQALDRDGFDIVSSRHESGAVGAADGYARIKKNVGVAMIVADQGLPNAVGGLAVAWHAQSPVLVLVATPPRVFVEAEPAIDQDRLALVAPLSKWARTVPSVDRLQDYVQTAIKQAISGRPGPVVLLIPEDQLQASPNRPIGKIEPVARPSLPAPDSDAIRRAADHLIAAKRPIIVTGAGATWSDSTQALNALAQDFGIPVLGNSMGRGAVAEDEQSVFSWPYAQIAAHQSDCVLLVGVRLTQRLGLGLPPRFAADAIFIQIDIEPTVFHRNRPTDLPIHADAGLALSALVDVLTRAGVQPKSNDWLLKALAPRKARLDELKSTAGPQIHPLQLGQEVNQRLPKNAVYVGDGADIQTWMYGAISIHRARGFLDHYPMGAMGSGTALAVGAAAALKEGAGDAPIPPVVLVTGDGAIGFHAAELHAAVLAGLNLKVIVGNDGAWGTELHGQRKAIGRDINTNLGMLAYEKLAEAFGAVGLRAAALPQLSRVLDRAFAQRDVTLVNVVLDPKAGAELKESDLVRMIMFSDILEGQSALS